MIGRRRDPRSSRRPARNHAGVAAVSSPSAYAERRGGDPRPWERLGRAAPAAGRGGRSPLSPRTTQRSPRTSTRSRAIPSRPTSRSCWEKVNDLPYGENPHQQAAFYRETTHRGRKLADAGPAPRRARPTFNDLLDLDRRMGDRARLRRPHRGGGSATPIPVGLASDDGLPEAYRRALETDPASRISGRS